MYITDSYMNSWINYYISKAGDHTVTGNMKHLIVIYVVPSQYASHDLEGQRFPFASR